MAKQESKGIAPLERSSYEFMAALLVASMIPLIPNWLVCLVCWIVLEGIALYICMASSITLNYSNRRKFFLSLCCLTFLTSISFNQIRTRYREENVIPPSVRYMPSWGPMPGNIPASVAEINGRLLDKYKSRFNLVVVLYHRINYESELDKRDLCKSDLVKIRPENIYVKIDYNQHFLKEMQMGATSQNFTLVALPRGMNPEDFNTLSEAESKGAQIVETNSLGIISRS